MTDKQNIALFRDTMRSAYSHQQIADVMDYSTGVKLDKLFRMGDTDKVVTRDGRVVFFWRTFRRRAAILYARQHDVRVKTQLDWSSMWQWIIDNWALIVKAIFLLVPFII